MLGFALAATLTAIYSNDLYILSRQASSSKHCNQEYGGECATRNGCIMGLL